MWALSIAINRAGIFTKQRGKIANILIARPTKSMCEKERKRMENLEPDIIGWILFDEKGRIFDSKNRDVCLDWNSREFDDVDVSYVNWY